MTAVWLPNCPQHPNTAILSPRNSLTPHGGVWHRTYGSWPGDLSVLSGARVPSVHWLIGKAAPNWCQMVPTDVEANHAAGANSYAVGVELEGTNDQPLTDWQVARAADVLRWCHDALGIPAQMSAGTLRVTDAHGWINHSNVATTPSLTHYDLITPADWDRIHAAAFPTPASPPPSTAKDFKMNDAKYKLVSCGPTAYGTLGRWVDPFGGRAPIIVSAVPNGTVQADVSAWVQGNDVVLGVWGPSGCDVHVTVA